MSKALELFAQAFDVFWNNRLRSLLTMLGLIIGVGSVIAILAVGDSTNRSVKNLLSPFSQSALFVSAKEQQPDSQIARIRYDDARRVAMLVPDARVAPVLNLAVRSRVHHQEQTVIVRTDGAGENFDQTPLAEGRRFAIEEISAHRRVCILSNAAKQKFFTGTGSVVGRTIRLIGSDYTVVGVQEPPLSAGLLSGNNASAVAVTIPYSLIPVLGYTYVFGLGIIAPDPTQVDKMGQDAISALKKIHGERAQYDERDIKSLNDGISKTFAVITSVVGIVAGISLLVGGVGIMNIMLVSVSERTREIGIRKAIGATRADILVQFLTEALFLCFIGAFIGLFTGVALAELVIHTLIVQLTGTVVLFSWLPIVEVAVIFGAGVGVVFGTYPAVRASYLNPIECLRYE